MVHKVVPITKRKLYLKFLEDTIELVSNFATFSIFRITLLTELCGVGEMQVVMSNLRGGSEESQSYMSYGPSDEGIDEPMRGMYDPDWDMWEEWMGWEGAGIRDYSSHINPYI